MILPVLTLRRPILHPVMTWLNLMALLLPPGAVDALNRNDTRDEQYGIYTNFDPTIALVIVVVVCAFFLLGVFSMFIRHCSQSAAVSSLSSSAAAAAPNVSKFTGLDPSVVEKFPVFLYSDVKDVKIGRETLECAICLSEFEDDETLRLLPNCNHVFHSECIDEWLASHVTCPVCRCVLAADPGEIEKAPPMETAADLDLTQSPNEVTIAVNDDQNRDSAQSRAGIAGIAIRPPRLSRSGRFPRSHSTGHSLVRGGDTSERYTLRLPEEVRVQIMESAKLKRTQSVNMTSTKEWSVRRDGGGSSRGKELGWSGRWSVLLNPAIVLKGGGAKSVS